MKKFIKFTLIILIILLTASAAGILLNPESRFYVETITGLLTVREKLNKADSEGFTETDIDNLKYGKNCVFDQSLMLINFKSPLPKEFKADLTQYENTDAYLNSCCIESFVAMREHIQNKFGERLLIMSSYRNKEEQQQIYDEDKDGVAAKPGESEHETGLGIDVYVKYFAGKGFLESEIGKYVNKNCGNFGFIIRYPLGKEKVTGFSYEPWHIRYVGLPHSEIIQKNCITLEEYLDGIEIDCFYKYKNYIISKQDGETIKIPESYKSIVISPDNQGNYIVTVEIS